MNADSGVELIRKSNNDYTMNVMDDEKHLTSEKQHGHLFVEILKSKRDMSPTTCQSNGDVLNETAENSRIIADKKSDNNHSMQSESNCKRQKSVCYDFKKGICRRRFCRYPHVMNADQVVFCHDFQNMGCFRANCRFIHRSIEDEEHYRLYGVFLMPAERPAAAANMNQQEQHIAPPTHPTHPTHPHPHPPHMNYYPCRDNMITNQLPQSNQPAQQFTQNTSMTLGSRRRSFGMESNLEPPKRMHLEDIRAPAVSNAAYNTQSNETHQCRFVDQNGQSVNQPSSTAPNSVAQVQPVTSVVNVISEDVINIYRLYEEHNLLRRRVEINEERLQELRATNTYLLQQNEQLRRQAQCSCTNTIVNPVTLTTASRLTATQQSATPVINAVSIAPVQMQATPIVSIASIGQPTQTQIITSSTPLAIAANTSQGQQLQGQLALASTQQAGQILGTSQITLATAPSMGIVNTLNTSQPLTMSANATQPIISQSNLISYPVMTHSILPH